MKQFKAFSAALAVLMVLGVVGTAHGYGAYANRPKQPSCCSFVRQEMPRCGRAIARRGGETLCGSTFVVIRVSHQSSEDSVFDDVSAA